ncbi:helix-turn-helix domain-containing protein [Nocardiopsis sp. NPDC006938]|uniref:helix-turn-helix domain-containing protein n=1 Tax=Nocardiopsis sp. NPDC006938 TaxID=3364337 RepID=UPI0036AA3FDF
MSDSQPPVIGFISNDARGDDTVASSPTVRRRRLARKLRELREAAKLTSDAATKQAGFSRGKLTRMERNEWVLPAPGDIEKLLDVYKVTDPVERGAYITLAEQSRLKGWWVGYQDVLGKGAYVGLEMEANSIRTVETLLIPGLLQTEAYARAVIRGHGITDEDAVSRSVEARMIRKQILARPDAPKLWAVIDESALRKVTPDLADQLQYLIDVQKPTLRIQVLPNKIGPHAVMPGGFTILDFPEDPSCVYLESSGLNTLFLEEDEDIRQHELMYDYAQASALSVDDSIAFIKEVLESVT